jgi:hypothetical protein
MSQWIIGGCFAVGIIALLGAIFLGLSERTPAAKVQQEKTNTTEPLMPVTMHDELPNRDASAVTTEQIVTRQVMQELAAMNTPRDDGQLHELSGELHSLRTQAGQMSERIGVMVEAIDHMEEKQEALRKETQS